jgi:hypothetical protein
MPALIPRHASEVSLVGLLIDARDQRRNFPLEMHHGVIVLSRVIRSLNSMQVETVEELMDRRETCALLIGLRLEISREALGRS